MPKSEDKQAVRITGQFRQRDAMMYDLKCDGVRITISIEPETRPSENWNVGAIAKLVPNPLRINVVGPSRSEALDALASEWGNRGVAESFPLLDWTAIREALSMVRAI